MPYSRFAIALIIGAASVARGQKPSDVIDVVSPAISAVLKDTYNLSTPSAIIIEVASGISVASRDTSGADASSANRVAPVKGYDLTDSRVALVRVEDVSLSGDSAVVKLVVSRKTDGRQRLFFASYTVRIARTDATSPWQVSSKKLTSIT